MYIHGMNQQLATLANPDQHPLLHRLRFEMPNVGHLYGVDWGLGRFTARYAAVM